MKLSKVISKLVFLALLLCSPLFVIWYSVTAPVISGYQGGYHPTSNPESLVFHVKQLSQVLPGRSDDVDKLNESADYIHQVFNRYTDDVAFQEYDVWGIKYKNVIARFGEKNCGGLYVLGAHYDSFDGLPGADDNASGVAGLLELSRLFDESGQRCKFELVAYSLEEPPYFRSKDMGSFHHAKSLADAKTDVALMVSIEMIGYFVEGQDSQTYPLSVLKAIYPSQGNFIALVSNFGNFGVQQRLKKQMKKSTPLPVYSINAPALVPGIDFSDHANYWKFDFPALMLTDTSFYRNFNYHTELDTWDTLDYKKMAMAVDGLYTGVTTMAERHLKGK